MNKNILEVKFTKINDAYSYGIAAMQKKEPKRLYFYFVMCSLNQHVLFNSFTWL